MNTLHVHLDESGDLNFAPNGTKYYIFAAAWTYDPAPLASDLTNLRFGLVKSGFGDRLDGFHARLDPHLRRIEVLKTLANHTSWTFASMVITKRRVNPSLYGPEDFYPKFATMLFRFVFRGRIKLGTTRVLIYTDTLPFTGKRAGQVEVAIKTACHSDLPNGLPFAVLHHCSESNAWIQVSDYCSWSVCRKWEHNDPGPYNQLKRRLAAPELDPTARGDGHIYY